MSCALKGAAEYLAGGSGPASRPDATELVEALARELAWARLLICDQLHEVQKALAHKSENGGQSCGPPAFACASPSVLLALQRDLGRALDPANSRHLKLDVLLDCVATATETGRGR
jgi:hypothetical protein